MYQENNARHSLIQRCYQTNICVSPGHVGFWVHEPSWRHVTTLLVLVPERQTYVTVVPGLYGGPSCVVLMEKGTSPGSEQTAWKEKYINIKVHSQKYRYEKSRLSDPQIGTFLPSPVSPGLSTKCPTKPKHRRESVSCPWFLQDVQGLSPNFRLQVYLDVVRRRGIRGQPTYLGRWVSGSRCRSFDMWWMSDRCLCSCMSHDSRRCRGRCTWCEWYQQHHQVRGKSLKKGQIFLLK